MWFITLHSYIICDFWIFDWLILCIICDWFVTLVYYMWFITFVYYMWFLNIWLIDFVYSMWLIYYISILYVIYYIRYITSWLQVVPNIHVEFVAALAALIVLHVINVIHGSISDAKNWTIDRRHPWHRALCHISAWAVAVHQMDYSTTVLQWTVSSPRDATKSPWRPPLNVKLCYCVISLSYHPSMIPTTLLIPQTVLQRKFLRSCVVTSHVDHCMCLVMAIAFSIPCQCSSQGLRACH